MPDRAPLIAAGVCVQACQQKGLLLQLLPAASGVAMPGSLLNDVLNLSMRCACACAC